MALNTKITTIIILTALTGAAQLRMSQASLYSLQGLSPLNEKNYFQVLRSNYSREVYSRRVKNQNFSEKIIRVNPEKHELVSMKSKLDEESLNHKSKKSNARIIKLIGFHHFMKPITNRTKIIVPRKVEIGDGYSDLNSSIPSGLAPTQSEVIVLKRFGDQAIQSWLQSPAVKQSPFGKAATQVESAMKVEASIRSTAKADGEPGTDHRFSFNYLALQAQAKMEYSGWTRASVVMDAQIQQTAMEISEKVFKNKDLVLSHVITPIEDRSSLGLRWSW